MTAADELRKALEEYQKADLECQRATLAANGVAAVNAIGKRRAEARDRLKQLCLEKLPALLAERDELRAEGERKDKRIEALEREIVALGEYPEDYDIDTSAWSDPTEEPIG